jgi:hypothetical protein
VAGTRWPQLLYMLRHDMLPCPGALEEHALATPAGHYACWPLRLLATTPAGHYACWPLRLLAMIARQVAEPAGVVGALLSLLRR